MPTKWDDATHSEKLLALFAMLLFNNREYSLTELTKKKHLYASKASVGRLLDRFACTKLGNLKHKMRGREKFYWLEKHERIPPITLNADGLYQLALCRDFLTHLLPEKMWAETQASLSQAVSFLPQGCQNLPPSIGASLSKGRIDYKPFQEIIASLVQAIHQRRVCQIEYVSAGKREEKQYAFAPARILAYHECLYVDGWRVTDDDPVTLVYDDPLRLAVQRFRKCQVTERSTDGLPALPPPEQQGMGVMSGEAFTARIWFAPQAATYVAERQWSADQQIEMREDGSLILTASMSNVPETVS